MTIYSQIKFKKLIRFKIFIYLNALFIGIYILKKFTEYQTFNIKNRIILCC